MLNLKGISISELKRDLALVKLGLTCFQLAEKYQNLFDGTAEEISANFHLLLQQLEEELARRKEVPLRAGTEDVCKACHNPISYVGPYWEHIDKEFRHIAEPTFYIEDFDEA